MSIARDVETSSVRRKYSTLAVNGSAARREEAQHVDAQVRGTQGQCVTR